MRWKELPTVLPFFLRQKFICLIIQKTLDALEFIKFHMIVLFLNPL